MDRLDSVERTVAEAAPQVPCPPDAQIPGNPQISHNSGFETEKQATPNDKGEFELEPQNRPLQQYGSLVGDDIKQKLASEIRADKFINFSELLPNPDRERANSFVFSATSSSDLKIYQRRTKRFITFQQWNMAFDTYMAIYIENAPTRQAMVLLVRDMLTYRREVEAIHAAGHDWFNFDHHFRMDREQNHCRFSTVRHDLLRQYERTTRSDSSVPFRSGERFDHQRRSQNATSQHKQIPPGYCRRYHTPMERCTFTSCKYKHVCPRCSRGHPVFTKCNNSQADDNRRGSAQQTPNQQRQGVQAAPRTG
jgi:hypothetical protein